MVGARKFLVAYKKGNFSPSRTAIVTAFAVLLVMTHTRVSSFACRPCFNGGKLILPRSPLDRCRCVCQTGSFGPRCIMHYYIKRGAFLVYQTPYLKGPFMLKQNELPRWPRRMPQQDPLPQLLRRMQQQDPLPQLLRRMQQQDPLPQWLKRMPQHNPLPQSRSFEWKSRRRNTFLGKELKNRDTFSTFIGNYLHD